jgi:hypothetical protein
MSLTGCRGALVENCKFEDAGEAPSASGTFGSKPKSAFCVEAERTVCRDVVIRGCEFIMAETGNTAFVADSGDIADVKIERSVLRGNVWTRAPRTVIQGCHIYGGFGRLLAGQTDPRDNTLIADCKISDRRRPDERPPAYNVISGEGAGGTPKSPLRFRNCEIDLHFHAVNLRWTRLENVTFNVYLGTDTLKPGQYLMLLGGSTINGLRIVDRIPAGKAPKEAYVVLDARHADVRDAEIVSPGGRILWHASRANGGYAGRLRPA